MTRASIVFGIIALVVSAYLIIERAPSGDTNRLKIGYLAISATTPLFVAQQEDLFKKHGLDVELIEFRTSNEISVAAAAGRIDFIGIAATNAAIDVMNDTGATFQLFLINAYVKRPDTQSSDFLLASPDITSFKELKGKTVAFMPGSIGRVFAQEIFPANGVHLDEIKYVELAPPQWLPAMSAGRIDAVTALEPFGTMIMENLNVNILIDGYYAEVMPRVPVSGAWFIKDALAPRQESAMVAVYRDALAIMNNDRAKAVQALTAFTSISDEYLDSIRLNEWYFVNDEDSRKAALDFAELFARNGGINQEPQKEWLWKSH